MAFNGTLSNANLVAGYMDLATAWKMEGQYLYGATPLSKDYGNPSAMSYFLREIKRATWFTHVPVSLRINNGTAEFGHEFSACLPKTGEYLLNTWLRVVLPSVTLLPGNQFGANGSIRWCRKVMHNILEDCNITFNEQQVVRLDNYILDVIDQYNTPTDKKDGYDAMIGDTLDLTGPHSATSLLGATLPSKVLQLHLPFFFARDTGLALPMAALLFNEVKINFKFRNWNELLILDNTGVAGAGTVARAVPIVGTDIATAPALSSVQVWATYALTSSFERALMADSTRDVIIEQYQTASRMKLDPIRNPNQVFEPKFTFAVKALFFLVRNTTFNNEWSNYTTASPYNDGNSINFNTSNTDAPIANITMNYESTTRLSNLPWDYFSQTQPYYFSNIMPREIGYGLYSYALNLQRLDPNGSTNFSKLGNVQVQTVPSANAIIAANGTGAAASGADFPQTYEMNQIACSYTVIRYADGQLTFPFV